MGVLSSEFSVFLFLSIASVSLFSFLSIASWSNARLKERDSFYKHEMLKKLSESQAEGAGSALEVLREDNRLRVARRQTSLREGGLVTSSIGLALLIFMWAVATRGIALCGLIVLFPGLALLVSSYLPARGR